MKARNLIVVMSDEHDPRWMGASGNAMIRTPHLDAMAAAGVRFPNAYTPCPICVPARAAFATGHRVHRIRLWDNAMPYVGEPRGWGHVLQDAGIRVESIGKLHYRYPEDPAGFDVEHIPMNVVDGVGMVWASIRDPYILRLGGKGRMLGDYIGPGESSYVQYDRDVTARTVDWLHDAARDRSRPFVLYVGLVAPHFPLVVPQAYFDLYPFDTLPEPKLHPAKGYVRHPWVQEYADFSRTEEKFRSPQERLAAFAAYFGLCSWLDENVGRILRTLRETGLADDTHVIYTSDHGDSVGARGMWGKSVVYEEAVKVPMILWGPDASPGVCDTPVDLLDLYPTILQGVGIDPAPHMDERPGRSLFELAGQPVEPQRAIFSEYHAAGSNTAAFMLRKGRWKYHYYVRHRPELFDLATDPEELTDLAGDPAHAGTLARLHAELLAICDPEAMDTLAKQDQRAMIDAYGGPEVARRMGAPAATPVPGASPP